MKTKNQIELTRAVAPRRSRTARAAVASLAFATAVISAPAVDNSATLNTTDPTAIRPFHVSIPETALTDLRRRLAATRWPDKEIVADESQGVQLATMQKLVSYWSM